MNKPIRRLKTMLVALGLTFVVVLILVLARYKVFAHSLVELIQTLLERP